VPIKSSRNLVEVELSLLSRARISELRKKYRRIFNKVPPPAFGPDLLRRTIAYRIQERVYGGLNASIRDELRSMVGTVAEKARRRLSPRRIKPGSILVRDWNGCTYRVTVTSSGFLYRGREYSTLSEIAREITGTRWNGPRFFGLRKGVVTK
jgi:hypothetical protein